MFEEFNSTMKEIISWAMSFAACLLFASIIVVGLKIIAKVLSFAWNLV